LVGRQGAASAALVPARRASVAVEEPLPALAAGIPERAKCFVGQLPFSRTKEDLEQLFGACGPVEEVVLLTDKVTGEKKGAAMVKFATPQHAAAAVAQLDGFLFEGSNRPITVDIARAKIDTTMGTVAIGRGTRNASAPMAPMSVAATHHPYVVAPPDCKLFVGQLPFSQSDSSIKQVFDAYGSVIEVALHRNAAGQKTGSAFVTFSNRESAAYALELNGHMFPGATKAITVSLAATKRQRVA